MTGIVVARVGHLSRQQEQDRYKRVRPCLPSPLAEGDSSRTQQDFDDAEAFEEKWPTKYGETLSRWRVGVTRLGDDRQLIGIGLQDNLQLHRMNALRVTTSDSPDTDLASQSCISQRSHAAAVSLARAQYRSFATINLRNVDAGSCVTFLSSPQCVTLRSARAERMCISKQQINHV